MNEPKVNEFLCFCLAIGSLPVTFLSVIYGWGFVDNLRGRYEVSRFIREHQPFVEAQRFDPNVHEFSFLKSPNHAGTLLVSMDVEDLKTYDRIRSDLGQLYDVWDFAYLPETEFTIRSNEDPGMDLGAAAQGVAMVRVAIVRVSTAVICALVIFAYIVWCFAFRPIMRGKARDFSRMRIAS